uniref:Uncharacterized protein n=1 Tax=Arundo donax TaxID=35708 RepID=A0A0A9E4Z8_ARUDO
MRTCRENPWITRPSYGNGRTTPFESDFPKGLSLILCIICSGDVPNSDVLLLVVCFGFICDKLYCRGIVVFEINRAII